MAYPSPSLPQNLGSAELKPVDEELITAALIGVIQSARNKGQSLEELTAEVLADDALLDQASRRLLSDIVIEAWEFVPYLEA